MPLLLQLKVWANKPIIAMYLTTRTEINSEKFSDILTYLQNDIPQYYLNVSENERAEFEDKYPVISPEFQEALKDRLFPPLHTPFELQKTPEDLLHQIILAIANTRMLLNDIIASRFALPEKTVELFGLIRDQLFPWLKKSNRN